MARRCIECGKIISSSVLDHYKDNHIGTYLRNGEDKFIRFPDAFAPEGKSAAGQAIKKQVAKRKVEKTVNDVSLAQQRDPEYRARVKMIRTLLSSKCDVQTYRAGKTFVCDVCQRTRTSGKRLLTLLLRYTVCYDCYNTIKKANPQKRGNKHFYINTPM